MKIQKKSFSFLIPTEIFFFFWAVCLLEDLMRNFVSFFFFSIKLSIIFSYTFCFHLLYSLSFFSLILLLQFFFFLFFYCRLSLLFNSLLFSNSGLTFLSCNIPSDSYQILLVVFWTPPLLFFLFLHFISSLSLFFLFVFLASFLVFLCLT